MDRADLQRLSKDELIELAIQRKSSYSALENAKRIFAKERTNPPVAFRRTPISNARCDDALFKCYRAGCDSRAVRIDERIGVL